MKSSWMFILVLSTITVIDRARGNLTASENPLPVGSKVELHSTTTVTSGVWLFESSLVVFISSPSSTVLEPWKKRAVFNESTSSLTIESLQVEDSGVFTLQDLGSFRANLTLSVQVPISNVTLQANATNLVEFNDTALLMCSVTDGTSLSYKWMKGNSPVMIGGNIYLSDGGATLKIMGVRHHDQGLYKCNVSNGISNEVSNEVSLKVNYGPSNVSLTVMPAMMSTYKAGSNISLWCSAESSPPAVIQWKFNGMNLSHSEPHLMLGNATESDSGNYKCLLHNSVTGRFSSKTVGIWILDPLSSVVVNVTGPAKLHESVTLLCEVTGTVNYIVWKKDGYPISADNTTVFGMGNKTLTLDPVQFSDSGHYKCHAFNAVGNKTSAPFDLMVYYGPKMPMITGPDVAKTGDNVTLSCNATSNPPSHYKWYFNDSPVSNMSVYVTPPLTLNMSGKYVCKVFNHITGKNSSSYKMLTVVDPITNVQLSPQMGTVMEGDAYNLTCKVTGPYDYIYWMKDGVKLQEDNTTTFYMNNKTVMFTPVGRYNTGHYKCKAMNAVGYMASDPYKLLVNYGPDTPKIQGPAFAEAGRQATFTCSAMSEPPSTFTWWYHNESVSSTSMFTTGHLSLNMSGTFACRAYNNVTGKTSTSSKMLTVVEAIESVTIQKSSIPINNENFTLTCVVVGSYDSIYWMKDNMTLGMNSTYPHMPYLMEKNTLLFTPLTRKNNGSYRCVATNNAAHHKSPSHKLVVNYGPLSVTITGPNANTIPPSILLSLKCSADSHPESDFYWFFNNGSTPIKKGSVISFSASLEALGNYKCKARNPVTNITMYETKALVIGGQDSLIFTSQCNLILAILVALSTTVLFN